MVFYFSVIYIGLVIIQPVEWIGFLEGIPAQELTILFGILLSFVSCNERLFSVVTSLPSKLFLSFIFFSILSVVGEGMSYAIGHIGVNYIKFYLGFLLLIIGVDSNEKLYKLMNYIVLFTLVVSYHCINLKHNGVEIGHGIGATAHVLNWRGSVQWLGAFFGSNTTALLLLFPLGVSLGLFFKQDKALKKVYYIMTTLVIGYSFLLTGSRGGFIGLLAILFYFGYIKLNIKLKVYLPLSLICMVLVIALKPQEEGRGLSESSTPERIELFHQGLQMFKEHPILGVGANQFPSNNHIRKTAHNIYLNHLAEIGFLGFFSFIMMFLIPFKAMLRVSANLKQSQKEDLILERSINIVIMSIIGFSTAAFFLSVQHEIPYILLSFITLIAINNKEDFSYSFKEIRTIVMLMIFVIALVYFAIQLYFSLFV